MDDSFSSFRIEKIIKKEVSFRCSPGYYTGFSWVVLCKFF